MIVWGRTRTLKQKIQIIEQKGRTVDEGELRAKQSQIIVQNELAFA